MKTQIKWMALGSVVSVGAGLLLGAAAFQPGLEPPAGPVSDTSPSLAEIEAKIDTLAVGVGGLGAPNQIVSREITVPRDSADTFIPGANEQVRLVSIIMVRGDVEVRDANGTIIELLRANSAGSEGSGSGFNGFAQYDLNVDVQLPLSLVRRSNFLPQVTVLFQDLD